jgi:O-antigen/teichoic acid export membrane protein
VDESIEPPRSGAAAATDAFWLILTANLSQLLVLGLALLLRRELGPAGMGYVAVVQLVAGYSAYLSLGTMQAAERDIPIAIARGDEEEARRIELAGVAIGLAVSVLVSAALLAIGAIRSSTDLFYGTALICASLVLFTQQFVIWAIVRLRTRLRFKALAWSTGVGAVVGSLLTVLGASVGGVVGALTGVVIAAVVQAALLSTVAGIGRFALPPGRVFRYLAVLSPAFLAQGLTATLLLTVDQLGVGLMLGSASLGLYSVAYLGNNFVLGIPTLIGTVIYPRLQRELGATSDAGRVFAMTLRTTGALVIAMPLLVAAFLVLMPALVFVALPDFRGAIGPMRLLLVGVAGLAFGMPAGHFLITVNRQWRQVAISGSVLALMACAYVVAWASGTMSIQVAAGVDAAAYVGAGIVMQVAAHRVAGEPARPLLRLMPILLLPMIELLAGAVVADSLVPRLNLIGVVLHASLQAALFGLTWAALAWLHLRAQPETRGDLLMVIGLMGRAARRGQAAWRRLDTRPSGDSGPRS